MPLWEPTLLANLEIVLAGELCVHPNRMDVLIQYSTSPLSLECPTFGTAFTPIRPRFHTTSLTVAVPMQNNLVPEPVLRAAVDWRAVSPLMAKLV